MPRTRRAGRRRTLRDLPTKDWARTKSLGAHALKLTNSCAIDVAQTAFELAVYARLLGAGSSDANADAIELMTGFTIVPSQCPSDLTSSASGGATSDLWTASLKPQLERIALAPLPTEEDEPLDKAQDAGDGEPVDARSVAAPPASANASSP